MKNVGPKERALRAGREAKTKGSALRIGTGPMSRAEARHEADAIRDAKGRLYERVSRFYEREGWRALGYESWSACCRDEFAISPRRGHQLVAEGRVIEALSAAAGEGQQGNAFPISGRAAREIEGDLEAVKTEIRERVDAGEKPKEVVADVVRKHREPKPLAPAGQEEAAPPDGFTAADLTVELERMDAELRRLQELVKSLEASDQARETKKWADKCAALEGRLQEAITTKSEAEKQAKSLTRLLKDVARAAGVGDFGAIVGVIQDLRR